MQNILHAIKPHCKFDSASKSAYTSKFHLTSRAVYTKAKTSAQGPCEVDESRTPFFKSMCSKTFSFAVWVLFICMEDQLHLLNKHCQSQVQNSCIALLTTLNTTQWISNISLNFLTFFITGIIRRYKINSETRRKAPHCFPLNCLLQKLKDFYMQYVQCKNPQQPQASGKGSGIVPKLLEHHSSAQTREQLSQGEGVRPWVERAVVSLFLPGC